MFIYQKIWIHYEYPATTRLFSFFLTRKHTMTTKITVIENTRRNLF